MKASHGGPRIFLLEIGTEEIPARMMAGALRDLVTGLHGVVSASLAPTSGLTIEGHFRALGTPRRLAVLVRGLLEREPDAEVSTTGPAVKAAFDDAGRPTRAAEGFARAQGVSVQDLIRMTTPKGEFLGMRRRVAGRPATEVLAQGVPPVVSAMTFPKMMRWGRGDHRFVRPIHTIVALFGEEIVPMVIAGVPSSRETRAHRHRGGAAVTIPNAAEYVETLRTHGVLVDIGERRATIEKDLAAAAGAAGGRIAAPPGSGVGVESGDAELLDEVTHLVEWPTVIAGSFEAAFLDLPGEVLVTSMRHHQKYFALRSMSGTLLNRFLTVADVPSDRSGAIRRGNEWVLRARLADARFFFEEDSRTPLAARAPALERVTFHDKLGSYAAKTARIARLVEVIRPAFAAAGRPTDGAQTARAAALSKCDLTTQVVKEFPELEGIVGGLYARAEGLGEIVARALYDQYLPKGADDRLPATPEGAILSLADRFDSQAGIFLLGLLPTGSRDPYALRRSVQGSCRIAIEAGASLSLGRCLDAALLAYEPLEAEGRIPAAQARAALLEFYAGRLQHIGEEAGLRHDSVRSALAAGSDDPLDAFRRMQALDAIRSHADFVALVLAHKRIKNIVPPGAPLTLRSEALREEAERALHGAMETGRASIEASLSRGDVVGALKGIAALRPALDRFFDEVLVMAEDREVRDNRLALLQSLAGLFLRVGDFSEIVVERA